MLPSKKLLTVIEPIQGVLGAVVGRKLELVETRRLSTLRGPMRTLDEGLWNTACGRGGTHT